MTYNEAMEYINSTASRGSKLGLSRTQKLLELIGNPQKKLKIIHVAGTNGKGSVCAMLESVLRYDGYKTGMFSSPHIWCFDECIRINGINISGDLLAEITDYIRAFSDNMDDLPTQFEIVTAIAFEAFFRSECDIVILETGMGGRLDSTNVISSPLISVITDVSIDHTAFLGDSIEKIALEKAGIIKNNRPVLFGGQNETVKRILEEKAKKHNSDIFFVNYDNLKNVRSDLNGSSFNYQSFENIHIKLLGLYQIFNASIVLSVLEILKNIIKISNKAVYNGMAEAKWNGRFEIIKDTPLIIFDGSHNPNGIDSAINSIRHYFNSQKVNIIIGVMADKDYFYMAKQLSNIALNVFTVTPNNSRALDCKILADEFIKNGINAKPFADINSAMNAAYNECFEENVPLIALGSLYMYADIKKSVNNL